MREYDPPRLLRGPHRQSVLANSRLRRERVRRKAHALLAASEDLVAECGGAVRLLLHHSAPVSPHAGRVAILIHGWEGSGDASYMLAAGERLWSKGYRVLRLNLRDHGDSHHLNRELFHSCRLDEVVGACAWVQDRYPDEQLYLGGYSLGGNFALRVAAQAPTAGLRLAGVAAVCPVLDPVSTMAALDGGWFGYRYYFIRKWRRSLERKRAAHPGHFEFGDLRRFRTLESMTEFFVREFTEFPDLLTYLRGYAITGERLVGLQIPASIVLAEDDPVIPVRDAARLASSPILKIATTPYGGHCGYLADYRLTSAADDYFLRAFSGESTDDSSRPR